MSGLKIALTIRNNTFYCSGVWTLSAILQLEKYTHMQYPSGSDIIIDGAEVAQLDSAGAWWIERLIYHLQQHGKKVTCQNFPAEYQSLLDLVNTQVAEVMQPVPPPKRHNVFYLIGKAAVTKWDELMSFLNFIGEFTIILGTIIRHPSQMQWRNLLLTIEEAGYHALPIIALLSFLIGVVLVYQMGLQLQNYGANIFIVNFSGMAILREFAPLITAIIVSGRTSSAITAQLGTMKINEEIDALLTMGLSPINRLVVPKIFGVLISLPLVTVWANIFGVLGSMVMVKYMLGINYIDFLTRFQEVIGINNYWIGVGKAPVFALIISLVGCFQGFKVGTGADSIGSQTTKSVVQAIFLIIIADAAFSIIFSWLKI